MLIQDRWKIPGIVCDCCKRKIRPDEPRWWETHVCFGGSGFNFDFCPECEKDNQVGCDAVIDEYAKNWLERRRNIQSQKSKELTNQKPNQKAWWRFW